MRRLTRRNAVILASVLFGALIFIGRTIKMVRRPAMVPSRGTVRRVVDGDTFHLTNGLVVRLLEIDAPEVRGDQHAIAVASAEELGRLINRKPVRMEPGPRHIDAFDRYLAYVFVDEDGSGDGGAGARATSKEIFVNAALVRKGLARAGTWGYAGARLGEIRAAERDARAAGRGIWARGATSD